MLFPLTPALFPCGEGETLPASWQNDRSEQLDGLRILQNHSTAVPSPRGRGPGCGKTRASISTLSIKNDFNMSRQCFFQKANWTGWEPIPLYIITASSRISTGRLHALIWPAEQLLDFSGQGIGEWRNFKTEGQLKPFQFRTLENGAGNSSAYWLCASNSGCSFRNPSNDLNSVTQSSPSTGLHTSRLWSRLSPLRT